MHSFAGKTALYSVSHFAVDFACAFFIFHYSGEGDRLTYFLLYNFFAFAMQMPLGVLLDKLKCSRLFAMAGMLLVAGGAIVSDSAGAMYVVLGLGNALFHIGAGRDVLQGSAGRFSALGIFVSPGAIGLFLGKLTAELGFAAFYLPAVCLCVLALATLLLVRDEPQEKSAPVSLGGGIHAAEFIALACLFAVVCIRSYAGASFSFPWNIGRETAFYLVLALALGKAAGGILADRFGAKPVAVVTLTLSTILFIFYNSPACAIAAIFLFNMTMPLTLGAVTRILPHSYGFGFGLLTFGLFIGAVPYLTGFSSVLSMPLGACAAGIVSAVLLLIGIRKPAYGE